RSGCLGARQRRGGAYVGVMDQSFSTAGRHVYRHQRAERVQQNLQAEELDMARTPSSMVELGTSAPDFRLSDVVSGKKVSRADVTGAKGMLAMFICRHCPFVKHVQGELAKLGRDYARSGVGIVAISANDESGFPEDSPDNLAKMSRELGLTFPYLYDETQDIARAYNAQCTPDFFLFD